MGPGPFSTHFQERIANYFSAQPSRRNFLGIMTASLPALACTQSDEQSPAAALELPDTPPIHEDTQNPPRLMLMQNGYGMSGLPRGGTKWSFAEKVRRIKDAGYEGFQLGTGLAEEPDKLELLAKFGLQFSMASIPKTAAEVRKDLEAVSRSGAKFLVVIAGHSYMSDEEIHTLVTESIRAAAELGVHLAWETHRAALTESPFRTLKLIEKVPPMRFCADLSHWALVQELEDFAKQASFWKLPEPDMLRMWAPLLDRTSNIQCRISNGDSIQVDVGDGSTKLGQQWMELWADIMRRWLRQARPGDVFPVAPELGPPVYSIQDLQGRELSDRWEQALIMKKLTEQAWKKAHEV